jgi:hypothetical protein
LTSLFPNIFYSNKTKKGGEGGMKPSTEVLAKEAAFWGQVKKVDPRKVCHK